MFMKKKNLFQDVLKINNLNKKLQYFNDVYDYFSKYMLKSLSIYQKQFCPTKTSFATIKKNSTLSKIFVCIKKISPYKENVSSSKILCFLKHNIQLEKNRFESKNGREVDIF